MNTPLSPPVPSPVSGGCASGPPKLLDQVRAAARTRHLGPSTEQVYVGWIRRFILFHGKRHPAELAAPEVSRFLTHLAVEEHVTPSIQGQARAALLFLYRRVLEQPLDRLEGVVLAGRTNGRRP